MMLTPEKASLMHEVLDKSAYWLINARKDNNSRTHQLINLQTK